MKQLQLFKELRRHRKLADNRQIDFEKNKVAKVMMYIVTGLMCLYLIMFAIIFAMAGNSMRTMSSVGFLCCVIPFIVAIDFGVRFMGQQTPSQIVKPYVLLPISKYTCVDFFLLGQMLSPSNFIWFVMLVPFCLMAVLFSYGFWVCLGLLFFFWLLELCISQFYLITRTLILDTMLWWIMPACVALVALLPGLCWSDLLNSFDVKFFERLFRTYSLIGEGIVFGNLLPYIIVGIMLCILFFINRRLQYSHVMSEVMRVEKATVVETSKRLTAINNQLDKLGTLGMFLGLEIRTILRNKNPRKSFITASVIVVVFSLVIIFTDVYDSLYMSNFWCMYNYTIFGAMTLVRIMSAEGNYIDGLMVRHENILQIFRAKYFFNCIFLFLPFLLMLPTVFAGKWDFMMVLSFGVFNAGFNFFLFFQLAVINRMSLPLNTKFISKNGMENNYWQVIVQIVCMFAPVVFVSVLQAFLSNTIVYIIMLLIGTAFILTHNLWLRNIYNRFMKRRYINMEGFRASR